MLKSNNINLPSSNTFLECFSCFRWTRFVWYSGSMLMFVYQTKPHNSSVMWLYKSLHKGHLNHIFCLFLSSVVSALSYFSPTLSSTPVQTHTHLCNVAAGVGWQLDVVATLLTGRFHCLTCRSGWQAEICNETQLKVSSSCFLLVPDSKEWGVKIFIPLQVCF